MAEVRPRPRRCGSARAIVAALCLVASQLLLLAVAAGSLVHAAALGAPGVHAFCAASPSEDRAPSGPAAPAGGDSGACLFCQRGTLLFGVADLPSAPVSSTPLATARKLPFRSPLPPAERRAGRGGGSSRAPPLESVFVAARS